MSKAFLSAEKVSSARSSDKPFNINLDSRPLGLENFSANIFDLSPDFVKDKLEPYFKNRSTKCAGTAFDVKSSKAYINAMRALQNKIKSLEKDKEDALKEQEDNYLRKISEAREKFSVLDQELHNREEVEKSLRASMKQLSLENESLKENLKETEALLSEIKSERDKMEKRFGEEIKTLLQEKTELRYKCKEGEDALGFVKNEVDLLKQECSMLREERRKADGKSTNLEEKLFKVEEAYREEIENLARDREKLAAKLEKIRGNYDHHIESYEGDRENLLTEIGHLRNDLDLSLEKLEEFKDMINRKDTEIAILNERVESLTRELEVAKAFNAKAQQANERLMNNLINFESSRKNTENNEDFEDAGLQFPPNTGSKLSKTFDFRKGSLTDRNPESSFQRKNLRGASELREIRREPEEVSLNLREKLFENNRRTYETLQTAEFDLGLSSGGGGQESRAEFENTIQKIIDLEKDLVDLNKQYKVLFDEMRVLRENPSQVAVLRRNMNDLTNEIQKKNQKLFDLKKQEDKLLVFK